VPVKFSQFRNFAAVVEAGAVRQAAKRLNLSQSSVTKSVQQLEQELGAVLLRRGVDGVAPTAAGKALLARITAIDAELRYARDDVKAIEGGSVGEIRVSASPTVAMGLLPRAVTAFQRTHPQVSFQVLEGVYPDILPAVRTGDLDFAICLVPEAPRDEALNFVSLVKDRVVPAVRADHPVLARRKLRLADLLDLDWIVYRRTHTGLDIFEQTFRANRIEPPKGLVECTSFACALALVESGNYVTLVPSQLFAGAGKSPAIAPVMLDSPMPSWQVAAISRADRHLSAACLAFLDELRRTAAKLALPRRGDRKNRSLRD
jgi:DNA-binding transcriptional LysR family regulator